MNDGMHEAQRQLIVTSAFIHKDGKLLVAKRAETKRFLPGHFELPGGKVEFGETMEDALRREVKEEIGVDILVAEPFYVFTYVINNLKHAVEVDYFAELADPSQEILLNENDHSEYHWVDAAEADVLFSDNERQRKYNVGLAINHGMSTDDPVRKAVAAGFAKLKEGK